MVNKILRLPMSTELDEETKDRQYLSVCPSYSVWPCPHQKVHKLTRQQSPKEKFRSLLINPLLQNVNHVHNVALYLGIAFLYASQGMAQEETGFELPCRCKMEEEEEKEENKRVLHTQPPTQGFYCGSSRLNTIFLLIHRMALPVFPFHSREETE